MDGVRIAILAFAAFVGISIADSRLSLQCKNIARDVIMNSCKGPRTKRSTDLAEPENGWLLPKLMQPELAEVDKARSKMRKRQVLYYGQPRNAIQLRYGYPESEYTSETFDQTELNLPGIGNMETSFGSTVEEIQGPPLMPMPYPGMGYPMRSVRSGDLLGFNLSPQELEELHEEIGDRMPRNSKDLNKKIFQHVAGKCCPNARLCYDNPGLIPCMGY